MFALLKHNCGCNSRFPQGTAWLSYMCSQTQSVCRLCMYIYIYILSFVKQMICQKKTDGLNPEITVSERQSDLISM